MKTHKKNYKHLKQLLLLMTAVFFISACQKEIEVKKSHYNKNADIKTLGVMKAELTAPPFVPAPVGKRVAKKLIVDMEIIEEVAEMDNGVEYVYWTFGGSVPGSFIRTRVGDEVEFTLKNHPDNKLPHNIDLHAVTGQGGGAEASFVAPGQQRTFTFKAINPGLYVYHCATAPVGMHIANGMYGLILVEPIGGLDPVDREFYVMQGDFYTKGKHGEKGLQDFDLQKAIDENPDYVVFNGKVGSLTGDNAIKAKVGESVRIFFGNGGPNLASSFHVIGEIFDKVYLEGGSKVNENVQTTLVPAGGSAMLEFTVESPDNLVLVDHSIFRAFNKGALGILSVEGEENEKVFGGVIAEGPYNPETKIDDGTPPIETEVVVDENPGEPVTTTQNIDEVMAKGKKLYAQNCLACHQPEGQGIAGAFPPLAKSDYLNKDTDRAINVLLNGLNGEITVNGDTYNSVMPAQRLSDEDNAAVLTYIYNNWGNNGTVVTPEQVKKQR
ncbi:nitrite reductase, copper-containing [Marivirga sp. S37H4]|uniref:Copper-containing nitrite reductase n=1 Tax=Marivirga aurantiaca TaxID=2802615 RepID=A0A934WW86_9BACT|nr:copper-containing nitrite reductase [Marivirga aurantiaca]MBK6263990.1 nitrite reductase, copper-containing [Marivirga aurantiaca]